MINAMLRYPFLTPAVFSSQECEQIIAAGAHYPPVYTSSEEERRKLPQGVRRMMPSQDPLTQMAMQRILPVLKQVNQAHYRFQINGVEAPHFCTYQVGECSPWHHDFAGDNCTNRKLTLLVFLSDPNTFEGGQFHLYPSTPRELQKQGSLLVFPSYLMHQVEPVLSGVRYSFITWALGPPFS